MYLYDTVTGRVCTPFKNPIQTDASGNPLDQINAPQYPACGE